VLWQERGGSEEDNFLEIKFDQHPLDNPNVDLRLGLDMKSLNIYLNMSCVNKIGTHPHPVFKKVESIPIYGHVF
jgi:hypothetical protein